MNDNIHLLPQFPSMLLNSSYSIT